MKSAEIVLWSSGYLLHPSHIGCPYIPQECWTFDSGHATAGTFSQPISSIPAAYIIDLLSSLSKSAFPSLAISLSTSALCLSRRTSSSSSAHSFAGAQSCRTFRNCQFLTVHFHDLQTRLEVFGVILDLPLWEHWSAAYCWSSTRPDPCACRTRSRFSSMQRVAD
jgi:hypothetical protein